MPMDSVGDILKQCVIGEARGKKSSPVLNLLDLVKRWPEIVGQKIADRAVPIGMRAGSLTVQAASPGWANELQLMSVELLEAVRTHCPQLKVKRLRFIA